MAGGKNNLHRERILDKDFGQTNYTPPATYWVALFSVAPAAAGGGTELSYTNYGRLEVSNDPGEWDDSITGRRTNVNTWEFPENGSVTTPIAVGFGLMDDETAGTMWRYGPVSPNSPIPPGKKPTYAPGAVVFTES